MSYLAERVISDYMRCNNKPWPADGSVDALMKTEQLALKVSSDTFKPLKEGLLGDRVRLRMVKVTCWLLDHMSCHVGEVWSEWDCVRLRSLTTESRKCPFPPKIRSSDVLSYCER